MGHRIAIVTEADEYVASGHLKECIVLAEELQKRAYKVWFWVNESIPKGFLKGVPEGFWTYGKLDISGIGTIISYIQQEKIEILIFNLRSVDNDLILKIKQSCDVQILCIDELGHRRLDCDIIINPMIDENYGKYEGDYRQKFVGNQYLILQQKYFKWNQRNKVIRKNIEKITISMGGVDRGNTTKRLIKWLQKERIKDVEINVVLGGGYQDREELERSVKDENILFFENIDFLDELFFESDLVFCAGGNTLHELACMGTPTIVIPSMPHEYQNGKIFESKGFGKCYQTFEVFEKQTREKLFDCFGEKERTMQSAAGKACADGRGYIRVLDIIEKM